MKFSISSRVLGTTLLTLFVSEISAQSAAADAPGAIQTLGCYKSSAPLVQDNNDSFQASGSCQTACVKGQHAVMATVGGTTCYCGDELPALDQEVDESKCNMKCAGFDKETCGGIGYWQLYLTGLTGDVQTAPNSTDASSTSSSHAAETVVVTQPPETSASSGGGPSKVGIAVGVVVGVVAVAGLVGGAIFVMRQRRKREIEEEYKAQLAVNSFVASHKNSETKSNTDQRLDSSVFSARRESVGSIADERDFSRRILQVRNPDHRGSTASFA